MVAVTDVAAHSPLGQRFATDDATLDTLLTSLRRSVRSEPIGDHVYDALNAVLDEDVHLSPADVDSLAEEFRQAAVLLARVVRHSGLPFPTDEMRRLFAVSDELPSPSHARGHVVRLATTLLDVLDLVVDDTGTPLPYTLPPNGIRR
ncbi:hypothetical protein OG897_35650 [Streptomyces sp. NBC_00237]|uniref:hypothetical protein n=1 Tax=Streptomyces sp. NBC_00237 TaxID=2975687 RepID=UPI002256C12A|nr:hypothetical protein [Streptomyces sp. NBC_00237]MCX5206727.1 hypothetical protein [Streptomyces sp. NBC_00237]